MEEKNRKWVWKGYGWIIVLVAFYLWSTVLTELISRSTNGYSLELGFISVFMILIIIIAAFSDREWSVWMRILWVIGTILLFSFILNPIASIITAFLYDNADKPWLAVRASSMLGMIPIIIWAMRRSKLFVKKKNNTIIE